MLSVVMKILHIDYMLRSWGSEVVHIARKLEGLGSAVLQIACKLEAGALKCCNLDPGAWSWRPKPLGGGEGHTW